MGSIYQKIETGFVFTNDMTDELVNRIIRKLFGIEKTEDLLAKTGILKMTSYYPGHRNVENVPVNGKVKKLEVSRLGKRNITDTSKSVDIQEIVRSGGTVIEIHKAVLKKNSKHPLFKGIGKKTISFWKTN